MMRFVRFLLMLVAGAFIMGAIRVFFGAMKKGMSGASGSGEVANGTAREPFSAGGELKKCAACGTYNAAANSVIRQRGGETYYYCSTECRARHAA